MDDYIELKECNTCGIGKEISEFYKGYNGEPANRCKLCANKVTAECRLRKNESDPQYRIFKSSKSSARTRRLFHNIKQSDIPMPKYCRYLGILLDYSSSYKDNSASIDRIDSTKGYTKDNIQVISMLANRMKSNATNEQLIEFAKSILRINGYEFQDD